VTDTETIQPDAVTQPDAEPEQPAGVKQVSAGNAALAAAEQAALAMPGVPGRDEFLALAMQARMLSMSGAAPDAIKGNPYVAFHVAMIGRDLGISPSAAIELIDVIETKKGPRISLSPQLLNGQIRRLGLGSIRPLVQERGQCVAQAVGPNGEILGETTFTWEDAQDAELVMRQCEPGNHTQKCRNYQTHPRERCNQGYVTYPKRMMWWRAAGFCADDYFPEAGLGLYSPEELGSVVDAEGRPIDPSQVALPAGFDDPADEPAQAPAEQLAERAADPARLWDFQERVNRLPPKVRKELIEAWDGEESRLRGYALKWTEGQQRPLLPHRLVGTANALINGWEGRARKAGVDLDAELAALRERLADAVVTFLSCWIPGGAAEGPQGSPEPDPGPGTAPEPQEDTTGDTSPPGDAASPDGLPDNPEFDVDPEPDAPEPGDDGRDWSEELRNLAARVRRNAEGVPTEIITGIALEVKGLHHTKVNAELEEAGIPADAPIDLRRMHVSLRRIRGYRANHGMPDADAAPDAQVPPAPEGRDEEPF
jgi:hypothetical protein